jgi:hypothetical protein
MKSDQIDITEEVLKGRDIYMKVQDTQYKYTNLIHHQPLFSISNEKKVFLKGDIEIRFYMRDSINYPDFVYWICVIGYKDGDNFIRIYTNEDSQKEQPEEAQWIETLIRAENQLLSMQLKSIIHQQ